MVGSNGSLAGQAWLLFSVFFFHWALGFVVQGLPGLGLGFGGCMAVSEFSGIGVRVGCGAWDYYCELKDEKCIDVIS